MEKGDLSDVETGDISDVEGGGGGTSVTWRGGPAAWATACLPYHPCPGLHPGETSRRRSMATRDRWIPQNRLSRKEEKEKKNVNPTSEDIKPNIIIIKKEEEKNSQWEYSWKHETGGGKRGNYLSDVWRL